LAPLTTEHQLFLSFVPSHWRRKYLEKGYNQSELLAKALANQMGLRMLSLAKKCKYTVSQLKLSRAQRSANLEKVFVPQRLEQLPYGATVLFVDDVTTTGSTLLQLARVIKEMRNDVRIRGAVLARNMN
jgi:predicted amidophosphoribosyltransferase